MQAEIYFHRSQRFRARIGDIPYTGHTISEDGGLFYVTSILANGAQLCHGAIREAAEAEIAREWTIFTSTRKPETSRERDKAFQELGREQRIAGLQWRNSLAEKALLPLLTLGDRIRATKAECGSREATFTFSHWSGGWIVSSGTASIAPGSVYSVNGKVFRV